MKPPARQGPRGGERRGGAGQRVAGYLRHHRRDSIDSLRRLAAAPLQSGLTALVVAIALALPAALHIGVASLQQLGDSFRASAQFSLFLRRDADAAASAQLLTRVSALADVEATTFISREQALQEFQAQSGFGEALAALDDNPLPAVILVSPKAGVDNDMARLQQLVSQLQAEPLVAEVVLDTKWLQRMHGLLAIARQIASGLGLALGLGVLLVVGNTIGLAIENRREEILVVKLVGGTNAFVRRPFLYIGWWYGAAGGAVAWLALTIGGWWLGSSVAALAALYQSQFTLATLGAQGLLLPIVGGGLGLLGAWLAVARQIAQIEPS